MSPPPKVQQHTLGAAADPGIATGQAHPQMTRLWYSSTRLVPQTASGDLAVIARAMAAAPAISASCDLKAWLIRRSSLASPPACKGWELGSVASVS